MTARAARERVAAALGAAGGTLAALSDPLPAIDRAVAREYGVAASALASGGRGRAPTLARWTALALGHAGARRPAGALCRRYGCGAGTVLRAVAAVAGGAVAPARLAALARRACGGGAARGAADRAEERARTRACLTCGGAFESEGPHNRMCDPCREERAGEPEDLWTVHAPLQLDDEAW